MKVQLSKIIAGVLIAGFAISTLLVVRHMQKQPQALPPMAVVQPVKPTPDIKPVVALAQPQQVAVASEQEDTHQRFEGKEGDHPHPITEDHERLFKENELVGNVLGAIDVEDVEALRKFSQQYQEQYPEALMMQRGINIIADCMEAKTDAALYAARAYYDAERASRLRRYVRRHCLGG